MNFRPWGWLLLTLTVLAFAEPPVADAQVIILPTSRTFSIGTSVSVPDRGFVGMGGVRYGALGRISSGVPGMGIIPLFGASPLFNHRATSQTLGGSQVMVGATITDLSALDRQVLKLGEQIVNAKQAAGLIPAAEKELPTRIPDALRNSFPSSR